MNKIIGGAFGLNEMVELFEQEPEFLKEPTIFLTNARSAIFALIERLNPRNVWMPSYLVWVMTQAVDKTNAKLKFFPIDYNLKIASKDFLQEIEKGDLVVFIDYFGFPTEFEIITKVKQLNAYVLLDCSQALLSDQSNCNADFVLFSPPKFIGVPDAGILQSRCSVLFENIQLMPPPHKWFTDILAAIVMRNSFDKLGGDNEWFPLYRKCDYDGPIGNYAMSSLSLMLLKYSFDYNFIKEKRIENYNTLLLHLNELAIYQTIPKGVVPLTFPIRIPNRNAMSKNLIEKKIFCPIHWHLGTVPKEFEESHKLSSEILSIPCDQRYDASDMTRIVEAIKL